MVSPKSNEIAVITYYSFDSKFTETPITDENIDSIAGSTVIVAKAESFFLTKLINLIEEGFQEAVLGTFDSKKVRLKILLPSVQILVDLAGVLRIDSAEGMGSGLDLMSRETLNALNFHLQRYSDIADVKVFQNSKPWLPKLAPKLPTTPSFICPEICPPKILPHQQ